MGTNSAGRHPWQRQFRESFVDVDVIVIVVDDQQTQRPRETFRFEPTPRFVLLPIIPPYQHRIFFATTTTITS